MILIIVIILCSYCSFSLTLAVALQKCNVSLFKALSRNIYMSFPTFASASGFSVGADDLS